MASPANPAADVAPPNPLPDNATLAAELSAPEQAPPAQAPETAPQETSAPEQGQQAPPADSPSSPAPNYESKEFKDFLSRHGGDPEKAAKAFFETNNRAAAMAKALKDRGIDPVTLEPIQTEQALPDEPPALPEAPVEIDAREVDQYVARALDNDQQAVQLAKEYNRIDLRLREIDTEIPSLMDKIKVAELRLSIPEIASDSFRKAEVVDELRELRARHSDLKAEMRDLRADKTDTIGRYSTLANRYREQVRGNLGQQVQERQAKAAFAKEVQSHEQEFRQKWPTALDQSIKTHNIPAELQDRFRAEAKKAAKAYDGPIEDIYGFVEAEAKAFVEGLDLYHRVKSAQFGAQAVARASTPGPTGPAAVAPHQPDSVPTSEADLMKSGSRRFFENLRAAVGGR